MKRLSVAIPSSVVSDTPHLRERTSKIGLIGRAAAIFRVDEIIVYPESPRGARTNDGGLIASLLVYMETPQYLRKSLFRLKPELKYAGILPPLRTPHHPLERRSKNLNVGEYREGVTVAKTREGTLVEIGVEHPALIRNSQAAVGKRITVKIVKTGKHVEAELAKRGDALAYWGYVVTEEQRSFVNIVQSRNFDLTIATSKYGSPLNQVIAPVVERWKQAGSTLVAFGAPTAGLNDMARREGKRLDDIFDFVVNTIPLQGTETVRTEEALIVSLAALNVLLPARS